ncbi:MAG: hypothetical protein QXZ60_02845 [Sulfolobales archaeon]
MSKGSIIGYVKVENMLNNSLGRIKRYLKSCGVMLSGVKILLDLITLAGAKPGPPKERHRKLGPLLRSLDELVKGA